MLRFSYETGVETIGCNGCRELYSFEVVSRSRGPAEPCRPPTETHTALATASPNPYESPAVPDGAAELTTEHSCWKGFKTGFRNGALWSLLLVAPTTAAFYGEMTIYQRIQRNSTNGTPPVIQLSSVESAYAWFGAIGTALTGITLPWALVAGFVGHVRHRRKEALQ